MGGLAPDRSMEAKYYKMKAQRDELLEACKAALELCEDGISEHLSGAYELSKALEELINKVEGKNRGA